MKMNKLMLAIVALLGVSALNADKVCIVTKKGFFGLGAVPATVAFDTNKKRLVAVKKGGSKVNYYVDDKGTQYSAKKVGWVSFKQSQMICNIKNAQNPMIQALAANKVLDATGDGTSLQKYTKILPRLNIKGSTAVQEAAEDEHLTAEEETIAEEIEEN